VEQSPKVRCADCGYLAVKNYHTRELIEAEAAIRQTGRQPGSICLPGTPDLVYDLTPICFALAYDLRTECGRPGNPEQLAEAFLRVIREPRLCTYITKWRQGFSPKEHMEMQILEQQKRHAEEQRQRDLAWQEERRKEDRDNRRQDLEWQAKQAQLAEKRWNKEHSLQQRGFLFVGLGLGITGILVLAAAQIIAALIARN
jgi:hypothetical protein